MRVAQSAAQKGSQKFIQWLVNDAADLLGVEVRTLLSLAPDENLEWISPLVNDDYAEYRDGAFLAALGVQTKITRRPRETFWPGRGPQWDALARTDKGKVLLIEAKSHLSEMRSACAAVSEQSRTLIRASLDEARQHFGSDGSIDQWMSGYYQYANRLAHLYWLRELNGIDAYLVFVYFVRDVEQRGPTNADGWRSEIDVAHRKLKLSADLRAFHVHDLYFDVTRCGA